MTLLDNHDLPRIASDCGGDLDRVRQALTFQLTARGTPAINYGTEAALKGAREPENRGDMRFGEQPLRSHIQKLLRLRAQHPALQSGAPLLLLAEAEQLVYARVAGTEVAIIAVNASEKARAFELPPALARADIAEALSGQQVARGALPLPPRSTRLFLLKPQEPHNFSQLAEQAAEQWREGKRQREVRFQAKGLELSAGEQAFIVGSGLEMGVWKPENGLGPFDRDGRLTVRLPVASAYELKLAIRAADGSVRWAGGANEVLFIPEGNGALDVALAW